MSEMGSERSANVVLTSDVTGYTTGMRTAAVETTTLNARLTELTQTMDRMTKSAGTKLQFLGGGTLASIGAATTAYALLDKQISQLHSTSAVTGKSFGEMARSVDAMRAKFPVSANDVSALVNQLSKIDDGTEGVRSLAETFVRLGAATGESSQNLMSGLTQLQRQMGTTQRETKSYANVLTELSHRSGVSAQGILEFSSVIAPIGRVAGMTQTELMGVSTAFTQAGQDGYLAANAFNKMLNDIMQSVVSGNPDLAKYANLIGVTVEQFQKMDKTKAIIQVFDELNRMGPQAIQVLNRMGLDGMRTMKSITAMTQQTGGIGKAVAEAQVAYNMGGQPNNALNRGSEASMKGLLDSLTRLKNTMAMVAESMGSTFAPAVNGLVKGVNAMGQAFQGIIDGPAGQFLKLLGGIAGTGALVAGTLFKLAGPLAAGATIAALTRNYLRGGIAAGNAVGRGLPPSGIGLTSSARVATGQVNPIARGMWSTGYNIGNFIGRHSAPPGSGASMASRVLGAPLHAGALVSRFLTYGLEPLMHPTNIGARTTLLPPGATFRESLTALRAGGPYTSRAARMYQSGMSQWERAMGRHAFTSDLTRAPGVPYAPWYGPSPDGRRLMGGHSWGSGFPGGLRNFAGATLIDAPLGMLKAAAGGTGLVVMGATRMATRPAVDYVASHGGALGAAKALPGSMLRTAGAGLGAIGSAAMAHPIMTAAMAGYAGYMYYQGVKDDWNADENKLSFMDAYSKAVGEATSATNAFAAALRAATPGSKDDKTLKGALTITSAEAMHALGPDYKYTNKSVGWLDRDTLKAVVQQTLGGQGDSGAATPAVVDRLAMDLTKRFGSEHEAMKFLKDAYSNRGQFDYELAAEGYGDIQGNKAGHLNPDNEKANKYRDVWISSMEKEAQLAGNIGGRVAWGDMRRGQMSSFLQAFATQHGEFDLENFDLDHIERLFDQYFAGGGPDGKGIDLGETKKGWGPSPDRWFPALNNLLNLSSDIDFDRVLAEKGDEAPLEFYRQLVSLGKDTESYDGATRLLRSQNLTRPAVQTALEGGSSKIWVGAGKERRQVTVDRDYLTQTTSEIWPQVKGMAGSVVTPQDKVNKTLMDLSFAGAPVGSLFMGNEAITNAIKPENSQNMNSFIRGTDAMVEEMKKAGLSTAEMVGALEKFKNTLKDPGDRMYQLAEAAQEAAKQLAAIDMAFASPSGKYQQATDTYNSIIAGQKGEVGPDARRIRKDALLEVQQATVDAAQMIKGWYIQTREFDISMKQSQTDFNIGKRRTNEQYRLGRSRARDDFETSQDRAQFEFKLSVKRSDHDYNLMRERAEFEYQLSRARAYEDFNIQREYAEREYDIARTRAQEDYDKNRERSEDAFALQMKDAYFDYNRSRLWAEEDFNHQVQLMAEQTAREIMNIYERVNVQRTWSATGLLHNAEDQLRRLTEQTENLDKLRALGMSNDTIQMLGLAEAQNAQQADRLTRDLMLDPSKVAAFNKMTQDRTAISKDLATDEGSASWEEMNYQHQLAMERNEEQFKTSISRAHRNFRIQMRHQRQDFREMMREGAEDFQRNMEQNAENFERNMRRMARDHKRQMANTATDYAESMKRMRIDHKRQVNQAVTDFDLAMDRQREDHKTQIDHMISDYERQTNRARRQFRRTAKDMTMSIEEIFTKAGKTLRGELKSEMTKIKDTWTELEGDVVRRSARLLRTIEQMWGIQPKHGGKQGNDGRTATEENATNRANNERGGGGGGGTGNTAPKPVTPLPAGSFTTGYNEYGVRNPRYAKGYHTGDDYDAAAGTPILAVLPGKVSTAGWGGAYGNYVVIDHGGGLQTLYAHQSKLGVSAGDKVQAGDRIGAVGTTGMSLGDHLHFEVRMNGKDVDPDTLGKLANSPGVGMGEGFDPRMLRYPFEDLIESNPLLAKFFGGAKISKGLNRAVADYLKKNNIDLDSVPGLGLDPGEFEGGGNVSANIALGKRMAAAAGFKDDRQWQALLNLWMSESGWKTNADNPSSSAYGIPQGLVDTHGLKPPYYGKRISGWGASAKFAGGDPATQISWGLKYIEDTYGTPAAAWKFKQANNWYGDGAIFDSGPRTIGVGERGPEAVLPLNERGMDFITGLMQRFGAGDPRRQHTCNKSVPMSNVTYNYRIDRSANFHGAITVQAQDPREFAEKMRIAQRKQALTNPVLARRNQ